MKDFNIKLVNAYNKYVLIHKYKPKKPGIPPVKFLSLTKRGKIRKEVCLSLLYPQNR